MRSTVFLHSDGKAGADCAQPPSTLSPVMALHARWVAPRRVRVLSERLSEMLPDNASVLDIGCGNGAVSASILRAKPTISMRGIDVLGRNPASIPVALYDGVNFPFSGNAVDTCMLVDVLHHVGDIDAVLSEAHRVSRRHVLIKDHLCGSRVDFQLLKFMDWVGNRHAGVALAYNYRSKQDWMRHFRRAKLDVIAWDERLSLYPYPLNLVFGRQLHFVALLAKRAGARRGRVLGDHLHVGGFEAQAGADLVKDGGEYEQREIS
jgi:SAM-dependent methyltransferase